MKKDKVKDYTDYLIGAVTKSTGQKLKEFFFGKGKTMNCYQARSRDGQVMLLWMEAYRWSSIYCYPCVLETPEETMVFETGAVLDCKENNARLVERWTATVNRENIVTDYEVEELKREDFYEMFRRYRKEDLDRAIAQAERENGIVREDTPEELPEANTEELPEVTPEDPE